jgi:hypothetical protein
MHTPSTLDSLRRLALTIAVGTAAIACDSGTYVSLSLSGRGAPPEATRTIALNAILGAMSANAVLKSPDGGDISLPTDATLRIRNGTGPLTVTAVARSASGAELGRGVASTEVVAGKTTPLALTIVFGNEVGDGGELPDGGETDGGGGATLAIDNQPAFNFGSVVVNTESAPATLTVSNTGDAPSGALGAAMLGGANAASFAIVTDNCVGKTLNAGESCTITVKMTPAVPGTPVATISVGASPGGTATTMLTGTAVTPGALTVTGASTNFGTVLVGNNATLTFTVTNTGGATSGAVMMALSGSDMGHFSITGGTCMSSPTLASMQTCTAIVSFAPTQFGSRAVTLTANATPGGPGVANLTGIGQETFTLAVNKTGSSGNGSVTSTPPGAINCDTTNTDCTETYAVTTTAPSVTLNASPAAGSRFANWAGSCSGSAGCSVTMNANRTVTAVFVQRYDLTVARQLNGAAMGTVTSTSTPTQPQQISCGTTCTVAYDTGTQVVLTATPSGGSTFAGWSGAGISCPGTGACTVTMSQARTVTATFNPPIGVIATWLPNGTIDSTNPLPASSMATYVTAGSLIKANNLTAAAFANAFMGDNWPSGARDSNKYLEFSVTAAVGRSILFDSVRFSLYNNFDGNTSWELRSSVDGYATALASGTATTIYGGGVPINANVSSLGTRSGTVTFRFYTFNNSGTTSPLQRGFRGSGGGGTNLNIYGAAF